MSLLVANNITKVYAVGRDIELTVLAGASTRIEQGEFVAITGSSGCGKSTLLHILGALDVPTGGELLYDGNPVFKLRNHERDHLRCRQFGFVFQFYHLLPELTVLENVLFPMMIRDAIGTWFASSGQARDRAAALLEQVSLSDRLRHKPNQLSGGERQRVAIARALVNEPAILLADEPTGNLDKKTGSGVLSILKALHEQGQTVIMVTHDMDVARTADRTLRLEDGVLLEM